MSFDIEKIRADFPILQEKINGKSLVYLDNAATSQKPDVVIKRLKQYYHHENANIHRAVHTLSERATLAYENARKDIQNYLGAAHAEEIIFVRGATEAINLVASSFGEKFIKEDDEIILSALEHHSNIVPWQLLAKKVGAKIKVIPINDAGEIIFEEFEKLLSPKTKLVSVVHISNALGTINPIEKIITLSHQNGSKVLIDGAQSTPHQAIDVSKLNCDFFVFSGHKVFGPTGIGVLYGKKELLQQMPPYQGGGDMIQTVSFEESTFNELPYKFEAGTPHISGAIALSSALAYIKNIGFENILKHENHLLQVAEEKLKQINGLNIIGQAKQKASVVSFVLEHIHPHDIGTILNSEGIAIRAGHHCAMPIMTRFKIPATARASFAFYNTEEEIDRLVEGIKKVQKILL